MDKGIVLVESLREAEQTPEVHFTLKQKEELVKKFDRFGVNWIEHSLTASEYSLDETKKLMTLELKKAKILPHARAFLEDLEIARKNDIERIAVYLSVSDVQLKYKLKMSKEDAEKRIVETCQLAKSNGITIERFTLEDASRASIDFVIKCAKLVEENGAKAVGIPDTCGHATPKEFGKLIEKVHESIKIPIQVHCHNDRGLATANCLAGFENGATQFSTTFNGLGERAGIAPTQEIAVNLQDLYNVNLQIDRKLIPEIASLVEKYSGIPQSRLQPITGKNVFTHKAGTHHTGIVKNPDTYETIAPETLGRTRDLVFGELSGKNGIAYVCEKVYGIKPSNKQLELIVEKVKSYGHEWGDISSRDVDFARILSEVMGLEVEELTPYVYTEDVAILHVYTESQQQNVLKEVAKQIKDKHYVLRVYEVTGDYTFDVMISAPNLSILNSRIDEIGSIPKVYRTQTHIVLKAHKY
ncbi:MAG: Lrp/AsnC ligand binding domain-containing protein [Candidatus Bathyarchaeia archaeon]